MKTNGVIVVAGASRGIGKWLAEDLANAGYSVIGFGRTDVDQVESDAWEYQQCDVTKVDEVSRLFQGLRRQKKEVYACVYAAGIHVPMSDMIVGEHDIRTVFQTNTFGCFSVFQIAARSMMRSNSGRLISLGSVHQYLAASGAGVYAASKVANERFSAALARDLAPLRITVNTVAISVVEGQNMSSALSDDQKQRIVDATLLRREISRQEITGTILYLLSEASDAVTAQTLVLGGLPHL